MNRLTKFILSLILSLLCTQILGAEKTKKKVFFIDEVNFGLFVIKKKSPDILSISYLGKSQASLIGKNDNSDLPLALKLSRNPQKIRIYFNYKINRSNSRAYLSSTTLCYHHDNKKDNPKEITEQRKLIILPNLDVKFAGKYYRLLYPRRKFKDYKILLLGVNNNYANNNARKFNSKKKRSQSTKF